MLHRNHMEISDFSTSVSPVIPAIPEDTEYLALVGDILAHPSVSQMHQYIQHGDTSCLVHSVHVSYLSYVFCKRHGMDTRSVARAGLLHDLFLYDWHLHHRAKGERPHGLEHPKKALMNARAAFSLTEKEENIILRHMWPLTLTPPRYAEAYVVVWMDKFCTVMEVLRRPVNLQDLQMA